MSINSPIIAGSPAVTRGSTATVAIDITSTAPPAPDRDFVDGSVVLIPQEPRFEGQILVYKEGDTDKVIMYVVVDSGHGYGFTLLSWKVVQNWGIVIDPRTGKRKDPDSGFYSSLAP